MLVAVVRPTLTPIGRNGIDNTSSLIKVTVLGEGDQSINSCYVKSLCRGLDITSLATAVLIIIVITITRIIFRTLAKLAREPGMCYVLYKKELCDIENH